MFTIAARNARFEFAGTDIEDAIRNLQEATELYLEEFPMEQTARPLVTTFEVAVDA